MRTLTEEDIRARAYKLWKAAGEHSTKMDEFWYQAEKELLADRASDNSAPSNAPCVRLPRPVPYHAAGRCRLHHCTFAH